MFGCVRVVCLGLLNLLDLHRSSLGLLRSGGSSSSSLMLGLLGDATLLADLGLLPATSLEVLLGLDREVGLLGAAGADEGEGDERLVLRGTGAAALGLGKSLLLEDPLLVVGEEEVRLAVTAVQRLSSRSPGLGLLCLTALGAPHGRSPRLVLEEELILARPDEGVAAVAAGQIDICRIGLLLLGSPRKLERILLGLLRSLDSGLLLRLSNLSIHLLLELNQTIGRACKKLLDSRRVIPSTHATEQIKTIRLRLEEKLTSEEGHSGCGVLEGESVPSGSGVKASILQKRVLGLCLCLCGLCGDLGRLRSRQCQPPHPSQPQAWTSRTPVPSQAPPRLPRHGRRSRRPAYQTLP